jgi:ring-1,2-phenylacetyl-CoA epoxidase subunit PaaE
VNFRNPFVCSMKLEVTQTSFPTADSITLRFKKTSELAKYKPGQHASLVFSINGKKLKRSYSFHTSPHLDEDVAITVRTVTDGVVSNYLFQARESVEVELDKITGNFYIDPSEIVKRHLVMFAGGSGITPIISMIRSIMDREPRSSVSLVYSNQAFQKILFLQDINSLEQEFGNRFSVYHVITKDDKIPADFPVYYKGRLSKLVTRKLIKTLLTGINYCTEFYLCGPHGFMQIISETLRELKVDTSHIFKEHFYIPEKEERQFDWTSLKSREIGIQLKGTEKRLVVESGKSILQAALDNDIKLSHSCTEGQCGVCRAFLLQGKIKLRKNHILEKAEIDSGQILLCQAFPLSDDVTVKPIN